MQSQYKSDDVKRLISHLIYIIIPGIILSFYYPYSIRYIQPATFRHTLLRFKLHRRNFLYYMSLQFFIVKVAQTHTSNTLLYSAHTDHQTMQHTSRSTLVCSHRSYNHPLRDKKRKQASKIIRA